MKGSDIKILLKKLENWYEYKLYRHGENLKKTVNIKNELFVEAVSALLDPFAADDLMYHFLILYVGKII